MTVLARLAVSGFTYIPKPEKPIARPAVVADPYVSAFRNFLETTRNNSSSVVRVVVTLLVAKHSVNAVFYRPGTSKFVKMEILP